MHEFPDTLELHEAGGIGEAHKLDHIVPFNGHNTVESNLQPTCCRHHHVRHEAGWTPKRRKPEPPPPEPEPDEDLPPS